MAGTTQTFQSYLLSNQGVREEKPPLSPVPRIGPAPSAIIDYSKPLDLSKINRNNLEKIRKLGVGDVGKVYLVHVKGFEQNSHLYALKVLNKEEMIDRNKVQRVLTERDILCTAKHPFIVSYYTSFQDELNLYILMEYCAGGEFFRFLQRQPNHCISEEVAKFYAAEVLMAIEYLHKCGIIYRDLKPENILLHESGHIRLTDFDLSKETGTRDLDEVNKNEKRHFFHFLHRGHKKKRLPQYNSFVGTAEYIAPEVITGFGYDATVDWWTLGILLYEMLYGKTPFVGSDMNDTFKNILHKELSFPVYSQGRSVSKECKDLIKKLLNPDQKKRLGHKRGAVDLKSHPFFSGVNWDTIHLQLPPIVPRISDPYDLSHFRDDMSDSENEEEEIIEKIYSVEDNLDELEKLNTNNKVFKQFAYKPTHQLTNNSQA